MDLCGKSSGFADFENTVDRGSAVILDAGIPYCTCLMFVSWVLLEIWNANFSSALGVMSMSSYKLFLFSIEVHLNSGVIIGIVLCCCHQTRCLLYYLGEINNGIYMYQFTFEPLHFCLWMWLWFRIWRKLMILAHRRIWRQKGTGRQICIPGLFSSLDKRPMSVILHQSQSLETCYAYAQANPWAFSCSFLYLWGTTCKYL